MDRTILEYLAYSSLIIAIVTGFYWLFLRKETFYHWNRWVLLGSLFIALIYPLIPVPNSFLQAKQDLNTVVEPMLGELLQTKQDQARVVEPMLGERLSAEEIIPPTKQFPWSTIVFWIYLTGVLLLSFRLFVQLGGVFRQLKKAKISKGKQYHLASLKTDIAPFSFGKYIFLNPDKYNETEFFQILNHEKIHVRLKHSIDLILAELLTIFQWFNPMAWLFRYLTVENLEFQVDEQILSSGEDRKDYQYHLLKIAIPNYPLSITTNYNQSLIKKRITMMNRKKSSLSVVSKYAFLLPLLFLALVAFKKPVLHAQTPNEQPAAMVKENAKPTPAQDPQEASKEAPLEEANSTPKKETDIVADGIYCVFTVKISARQLEQMEEELAAKGIDFHIGNKNFDDGLLTSIRYEWNDDNGHNGNSNYDFSSASDKVYFYLGKDRKGERVSGSGNRSKNGNVRAVTGKMPDAVKRALDNINSGYKIGSF